MNEEKFPARKAGIGGSNIDPILGLSPCKTANGFAVKDWSEEKTDGIPETYLT